MDWYGPFWGEKGSEWIERVNQNENNRLATNAVIDSIKEIKASAGEKVITQGELVRARFGGRSHLAFTAGRLLT